MSLRILQDKHGTSHLVNRNEVNSARDSLARVYEFNFVPILSDAAGDLRHECAVLTQGTIYKRPDVREPSREVA
jgi:hypothetical protein